MSGDTVTGEALQFTNDNKFAYAYSGNVTLPANSLTTMLKFVTSDPYIVGSFQLEGDFKQLGNDAVRYQMLINNIVVIDTDFSPANDATYADSPTQIIIPSYSDIEIKATHSQGGVAIDFQAIITGKVGMPPRVGNLDD